MWCSRASTMLAHTMHESTLHNNGLINQTLKLIKPSFLLIEMYRSVRLIEPILYEMILMIIEGI